MSQSIGYIALVAKDYDEAIDFYVRILGFTLIEDTYVQAQNKRSGAPLPFPFAYTRATASFG
jgi:catechol 2,3-dioxygenase-like lactoylglutathione lyase family enzyme